MTVDTAITSSSSSSSSSSSILPQKSPVVAKFGRRSSTSKSNNSHGSSRPASNSSSPSVSSPCNSFNAHSSQIPPLSWTNAAQDISYSPSSTRSTSAASEDPYSLLSFIEHQEQQLQQPTASTRPSFVAKSTNKSSSSSSDGTAQHDSSKERKVLKEEESKQDLSHLLSSKPFLTSSKETASNQNSQVFATTLTSPIRSIISSSSSPSSNLNSTTSFSNVALNLKAKVSSLNDTIACLQLELSQQKQQFEQELKRTQESNLSLQQALKEKYEASIKKQLTFIDSLVQEKQAYTQHKEADAKRLLELENMYQQRAIDLQLSYDTQLKDAQTLWQSKQAKALKAAAIKGLQPEIDRLIAQHEQEVQRQRSAHEEKALRVQNEREIETRRILLEEKARWRRESDQDRDEREIEHQQSTRALMEAHANTLDEQRNRFHAEIEIERQRYSAYCLNEPIRVKAAIASLVAQHEATINSIKDAHNHTVKQMQAAHIAELAQEKSTFESDFDLRERRLIADKDIELKSKETLIRAEAAKERDQQIDLVVSRLGEESVSIRKTERARADRAIDQHKQEMIAQMDVAKQKHTELEQRISRLQSQYEACEERCRVAESHLTTSRSSDRARNLTVETIQDKLQECETRLSIATRNEAEAHSQREKDTVMLNERHQKEKKLLQDDANERLRLQQFELTSTHSREIETIKSRVAESMSKKDNIIAQIQRELKDCQQNMLEMQKIVGEQRAQLLTLT